MPQARKYLAEAINRGFWFFLHILRCGTRIEATFEAIFITGIWFRVVRRSVPARWYFWSIGWLVSSVGSGLFEMLDDDVVVIDGS